MTIKKTKNETSIYQDNWRVTLGESALGYLNEDAAKGASRMTAFLNLLQSCALESTDIKLPFGSTITLRPGQLVVGITELGSRWKWARETVRKFLDQLEDFGLLVKQQLDRCSLITLNLTKVDGQLEEQIAQLALPEELSDEIDRWFEGEIDTEGMAAVLAHYFDFERNDECFNNPEREIELKIQTMGLWLKRVAEHCAGESFTLTSEMWDTVKPTIAVLYAYFIQDDWEKWATSMRYFQLEACKLICDLEDLKPNVLFWRLVCFVTAAIHVAIDKTDSDAADGPEASKAEDAGCASDSPGFPYSGL